MNNCKRLYRNVQNKMLSGVCSGIGDYFNMDPVLVRLLWVVLTCNPCFPGVIVYIVAALVIPANMTIEKP